MQMVYVWSGRRRDCLFARCARSVYDRRADDALLVCVFILVVCLSVVSSFQLQRGPQLPDVFRRVPGQLDGAGAVYGRSAHAFAPRVGRRVGLALLCSGQESVRKGQSRRSASCVAGRSGCIGFAGSMRNGGNTPAYGVRSASYDGGRSFRQSYRPGFGLCRGLSVLALRRLFPSGPAAFADGGRCPPDVVPGADAVARFAYGTGGHRVDVSAGGSAPFPGSLAAAQALAGRRVPWLPFAGGGQLLPEERFGRRAFARLPLFGAADCRTALFRTRDDRFQGGLHARAGGLLPHSSRQSLRCVGAVPPRWPAVTDRRGRWTPMPGWLPVFRITPIFCTIMPS